MKVFKNNRQNRKKKNDFVYHDIINLTAFKTKI